MDDALEAVKDFISANLEAQLAIIDVEKGCIIERWKILQTYESKHLQCPLIEILPVETAADYQQNMVEHWEIHSIDIEVGIMGQDEEIVQRDLLAYRKAIKRIVALDMTAGGAFVRWQLGRAQYSPLITAQKEKKLLKILKQNILCRVLAA